MKRVFEVPDREGIDLSRCTEMTIRLLVNTDTYAKADTIAEEIEDSLEWLTHDHNGIVEGAVEWEENSGT